MPDPTVFTVVATGPTTASLDWNTAALAGVIDYSVFRRTPPTGALFVPGTDTPRAVGVTATDYNDTGLLAATAYEWQVYGRVPAIAPTITSANNTSFTQGTAGTFTVTATGSPAPTLSVTGSLPAGVTFTPGTGVLAGTPSVSGTFPLTFTAANGTLPNATQSFTLTVVTAWTPASIPNLVGWYQADDLATITAAAGLVSQWNNKAPGGANPLQQETTLQQPSTGTDTINGRNAIRMFVGGRYCLLYCLANPLAGGAAGTAFVVFRPDTAAGAAFDYYGADIGDSHQPYSGGAMYECFGTTSRKNWSGTAMTLGAACLYSVVSAANDFRAYVNRTLDYSTTTNTVGWNTGATYPRIGQNKQGIVGEVIFYKAALNTTDRQTVENYLRTKWGTP